VLFRVEVPCKVVFDQFVREILTLGATSRYVQVDEYVTPHENPEALE
jgi:hypothetical protein